MADISITTTDKNSFSTSFPNNKELVTIIVKCETNVRVLNHTDQHSQSECCHSAAITISVIMNS